MGMGTEMWERKCGNGNVDKDGMETDLLMQ